MWIPIFGWTLNPMFGAAAMSLSSFCVVTNALRLNLVKVHSPKRDKKKKPVDIKLNITAQNKEEKIMTKTIKIEGMMCPHCEAAVKKALEAIDGVKEASARNEERFALGRSAGQTEVAKAVNDAKKAGISNISLDVMLGTPKQTLSSLDETFEFIDKMNVTHISAYMLKIENGTKFFDLKDRLALPDEDTVCEMYLKTIKSLEALGFNQYEISNFSKPSFESKHNTKYWILDDYLGLGKSAHSLWHGKRFYYDTDWSLKSEGAVDIEEERIMLGLRLNCGIDKSLIKKDFSRFVKMGLMKESENKIALTSEGMLVSNLIISELL